jgi:hypothetical protein
LGWDPGGFRVLAVGVMVVLGRDRGEDRGGTHIGFQCRWDRGWRKEKKEPAAGVVGSRRSFVAYRTTTVGSGQWAVGGTGAEEGEEGAHRGAR